MSEEKQASRTEALLGRNIEPTIRTVREGETTPIPVTVGADPEFVYMDKYGNVIAACDRNIRGIGHDGAGTPAELRPGYTTDAISLANRVARSLAVGNGVERDATIRWRAAPLMRGVSLGGHLHFGVPEALASMERDRYGYGRANGMLNHAHHIYGSILGPMTVAVEGLSGRFRRQLGDYGELTDLRGEMRGTHWVMEWRAPGTWLSSPEVARGLILGGQALTRLMVSDPQFMTQALEAGTFNRPSSARTLPMLRAYYREDRRSTILKAMEEVIPESHRDHWFNFLAMVWNGQTMKYQRDIRSAWGVSPEIPVDYIGRDKKPDLSDETMTLLTRSTKVFSCYRPKAFPDGYEGFSVRTSRRGPHHVAQLAGYYMKLYDLPVTPIHLYILRSDRGFNHWISPAFEPILAMARRNKHLSYCPVEYEINSVQRQEGELAIGFSPEQLDGGGSGVYPDHPEVTKGMDAAARFTAFMAAQAAVLRNLQWESKTISQIEEEEYRGANTRIINEDGEDTGDDTDDYFDDDDLGEG